MSSPTDTSTAPRSRRRPAKPPQGQMALSEHLREARNRLLKSAVAAVAGMAGGFFVYAPFMAALKAPVDALNVDGREAVINFTGVGSSFNIMVEVSAVLGLVLSSPVWLYQPWAFIVPGLRATERRYVVGFLAAAVPLFLTGVAVSVLCLPAAVFALTAFTPEGSSNIIAAHDYIRFVLQLVLTFGIAFVLPVFLVVLNLMGLVSGRAVAKSWRIVVVAVMLVSAMAAPGPDPMTMFYLAAPLLALFFVAVGLCLGLDRRRGKKAAAVAQSTAATAATATPGEQLEHLGHHDPR